MTETSPCPARRHGHPCERTGPHGTHRARYRNDEGADCTYYWRDDTMTRPGT